ncbi:hypothetical protein A2363_00945 [Candidatus Gottesmanbacteria bacterium RIFOXYB1_FULL_47_11]|uniref:Uncharacterized protein n=1 Tax=Candidatus Gottesmanbacteria bacterium RIFOXYB1_FULL_47_11 TaxID=1798401 RepID=A0A1F6BGI1_9BACT|nr:MAG: hypothetical protein A2363_00945 [Candidatus Gottesmanbacteria bacterium RIFOXYB1_FULL_47_11]
MGWVIGMVHKWQIQQFCTSVVSISIGIKVVKHVGTSGLLLHQMELLIGALAKKFCPQVRPIIGR